MASKGIVSAASTSTLTIHAAPPSTTDCVSRATVLSEHYDAVISAVNELQMLRQTAATQKTRIKKSEIQDARNLLGVKVKDRTWEKISKCFKVGNKLNDRKRLRVTPYGWNIYKSSQESTNSRIIAYKRAIEHDNKRLYLNRYINTLPEMHASVESAIAAAKREWEIKYGKQTESKDDTPVKMYKVTNATGAMEDIQSKMSIFRASFCLHHRPYISIKKWKEMKVDFIYDQIDKYNRQETAKHASALTAYDSNMVQRMTATVHDGLRTAHTMLNTIENQVRVVAVNENENETLTQYVRPLKKRRRSTRQTNSQDNNQDGAAMQPIPQHVSGAIGAHIAANGSLTIDSDNVINVMISLIKELKQMCQDEHPVLSAYLRLLESSTTDTNRSANTQASLGTDLITIAQSTMHASGPLMGDTTVSDDDLTKMLLNDGGGGVGGDGGDGGGGEMILDESSDIQLAMEKQRYQLLSILNSVATGTP